MSCAQASRARGPTPTCQNRSSVTPALPPPAAITHRALTAAHVVRLVATARGRAIALRATAPSGSPLGLLGIRTAAAPRTAVWATLVTAALISISASAPLSPMATRVGVAEHFDPCRFGLSLTHAVVSLLIRN